MTPEKRADILERFGWQPGEQEAMQRDMAERAARAKREETLAWCKARNEARAREAAPMTTDYPCDGAGNPLRGHDATKSYDAPQPAAADEAHWDKWRDFVRRTMKADIQKSQLMVAEEIGTYIAEERKAWQDAIASERDGRQTLEAEHAVVKQELATLKLELAELRGELKTRSALADMEARLARMEAPASPARLKTIG